MGCEVQVQKICIVCHADVAGKPRTKDPEGHYYCQPCYARVSAQFQHAAPQHPSAASGLSSMFSMGESQRLQVTADAPLVSVSIDLASADGLPALPDTEVWEWSGAAQIPCNSAAPPREGKLTLSASGLEFVCAAMPHQPIHIATDALRAVSAPKSGSHAPLVIAKARHDHPHARDDSGADIADLLGPDPVNRVVIAFMQGTETARLAFDVYEDDDETAANLGAAALHEAVRERCQANADKDQAKREAKIAALQPTRVALIACPKCQARLRVKQAGAVQCPGCGARARVRAEQFLRRSA